MTVASSLGWREPIVVPYVEQSSMKWKSRLSSTGLCSTLMQFRIRGKRRTLILDWLLRTIYSKTMILV